MVLPASLAGGAAPLLSNAASMIGDTVMKLFKNVADIDKLMPFFDNLFNPDKNYKHNLQITTIIDSDYSGSIVGSNLYDKNGEFNRKFICSERLDALQVYKNATYEEVHVQ